MCDAWLCADAAFPPLSTPPPWLLASWACVLATVSPAIDWAVAALPPLTTPPPGVEADSARWMWLALCLDMTTAAVTVAAVAVEDRGGNVPGNIQQQVQNTRHVQLHYKNKYTLQLCEIEDFVETHLCKLCVILRSRVLLGVCPHQGYRSATPLGTTV